MKKIIVGLILLLPTVSFANLENGDCNKKVHVTDLESFNNISDKDFVTQSVVNAILAKKFELTTKESEADFKLELDEKGSLRNGGLSMRMLDNARQMVGNDRIFTDSYLLGIKWKDLKTGAKLNLGDVSYAELSKEKSTIGEILNKIPVCELDMKVLSHVEENPLNITYDFYLGNNDRPHASISVSELGIVVKQYKDNGKILSDSYQYGASDHMDCNILVLGRESELSSPHEGNDKCIEFKKSVKVGFIGLKTTDSENISICKDGVTVTKIFSHVLASSSSVRKYNIEDENFAKKLLQVLNDLTEEGLKL